MTTHLDNVRTAVLALTRHQVRALVKAAQSRDRSAMDVLEESWNAVADLDPELTQEAEGLCASGQEDDLHRFQGLQRDEEREARQYITGPAGRIPRLMTSVAALLLVAGAVSGLLGMTKLPVVLVAAVVSVVLVVAGGVMSVRTAARRFDHVFRYPAMSCEHVWVAATDAALAAVLLQRENLTAGQRQHLVQLTGIWTEAGLPVTLLQAPVRYRLAA